MQWLFRTASLLATGAALVAAPFAGCSNSSAPTSPGSILDSGPFSPRLEAGASCGSSTDCADGLACLYPATSTSTCNQPKVCVTPPPNPCPQPQTMCSCLAEPIQVCQGYAENPVDPTASCDGGAVVSFPDAGDASNDSALTDSSVADTSSPVDAADAGMD